MKKAIPMLLLAASTLAGCTRGTVYGDKAIKPQIIDTFVRPAAQDNTMVSHMPQIDQADIQAVVDEETKANTHK